MVLYSFLILYYAPLRKKFIQGNSSLSMNKELRKAICTRSRFDNKFCKTPLKKKDAFYRKQLKYITLERKRTKE